MRLLDVNDQPSPVTLPDKGEDGFGVIESANICYQEKYEQRNSDSGCGWHSRGRCVCDSSFQNEEESSALEKGTCVKSRTFVRVYFFLFSLHSCRSNIWFK